MKNMFALLIVVSIIVACKEDKKTTNKEASAETETPKSLHNLNPSDFEKEVDGKQTEFFTLTNSLLYSFISVNTPKLIIKVIYT